MIRLYTEIIKDESLTKEEKYFVILALRLTEKISDASCDFNKLVSLLDKITMLTKEEQANYFNLFSKVIELKHSLNKLVCS